MKERVDVSMKVTLLSLGIITAILAGGLFLARAMDAVLEDVGLAVKEIEGHVENGGWEAAAASARRAGEQWEKAQGLGSALFHNQTLDDLTHALRQLEKELDARHERDSLRAARNASGLISLLRGSDDLSLENLL